MVRKGNGPAGADTPRDPAHRNGGTVDKDILAPREHPVGAREEEQDEQSTSCLYCLEGWVFLGSLGHDGEEIVEAIRCRRCCGTGRITR